MTDFEDRSDRWSDICLALIKAIAIILLIASLVYLAVAGMNYAVLGAVFFDSEQPGTVVTIVYALVLFAMALAASLLGLRASYEPTKIDPFCIAAGVLVIGVIAGVASGNFGHPDSAFGSGLVGGLNLFFGVIALVGAGIGALVIRPEVKPAAFGARGVSSEAEAEPSEEAASAESDADTTGALDIAAVSAEADDADQEGESDEASVDDVAAEDVDDAAAEDVDDADGAVADGEAVEAEGDASDADAADDDAGDDEAVDDAAAVEGDDETDAADDAGESEEAFEDEEIAEDEQPDWAEEPAAVQDAVEAEEEGAVEPEAEAEAEPSAQEQQVDEALEPAVAVANEPADVPQMSSALYIDDDDDTDAGFFVARHFAPAPEPRPVGDVRSTPLPRVARTAMPDAPHPAAADRADAASEPASPQAAPRVEVDEIEWVDFGSNTPSFDDEDDAPGFFGKHRRRR